MTSLHKICFLALLGALLLTACNRENVDEIVPQTPVFEPTEVDVNTLIGAMEATNADGMNLGCMTVLYPFELATEQNVAVTISSEAEFRTATQDIADRRVVDFVFPLEVENENGDRVQMVGNTQLGVSFASCTPTTGWTPTATSPGGAIPAFLFDSLCFDLVYPVSLEDQNGTPYTATSQADFINLCATVDTLYFSLPLTVDTNGVQLTINTQAEFLDLIYVCHGVNAQGIQDFACFTLLYPFEVTLLNGTTQMVNDQNDYAALVLSGAAVELNYPFTLQDSTGGTLVVNDDSTLLFALIDCGIIQFDTTITACHTPAHALLFFNAGAVQCGYDINFPVTVQAQGVTYVLNDFNDYLNVYNMYQFQIDQIELIYPISITTINGGAVTTLNSDADVCTLIDNC